MTTLVAALGYAAACNPFSGSDQPPFSGSDQPPFSASDQPDAGCDGQCTALDAEVKPDAARDGGSDATEPLSLISPFADGGLTYPIATTWTLAAEGNAILHYTTDGTDPRTSANSAAGKVSLDNLADGTVVKWTAGMSQTVHSFRVGNSGSTSAATKQPGFVPKAFLFDDAGSPIVRARVGDPPIALHVDVIAWDGDPTHCGTCAQIVTVGTSTGTSCLGLNNPPPFGGVIVPGASMSVQVPAEAGVYPVFMGMWSENVCNPNALSHALGAPQVGVLIVSP